MDGLSCTRREIALRVPPEDVRELYHTWLVGLWAGELQRRDGTAMNGHEPRGRWLWSLIADKLREILPDETGEMIEHLSEQLVGSRGRQA